MPGCAAPFVTVASTNAIRRVASEGEGEEEEERPTWKAVSKHGVFWNESATLPSPEEMEAARKQRDVLAEGARLRYSTWKMKQPPNTAAERRQRNREPQKHGGDSQASFWHHSFRDRKHELELGSDWASASQLSTQRQRIQNAISEASSTYLRHPPYPKQGSGARNVAFSYMSAAYDYRARQPSKEVAGTWPFMRTRPKTESARINEEVARARAVDVLAGGNWTLDPKYGNPVSRMTQSVGSSFRSESPGKWITSRNSASTKSKWRGNFATNFPPTSSQYHFQPMGETQPRWLHHEEPFADQFHDTVAINTKAEQLRIRSRKRENEISSESFSNFLPTTNALVPITRFTKNHYVESPKRPSSQMVEASPVQSERSYHKYMDLSGGAHSARSNPECDYH